MSDTRELERVFQFLGSFQQRVFSGQLEDSLPRHLRGSVAPRQTSWHWWWVLCVQLLLERGATTAAGLDHNVTILRGPSSGGFPLMFFSLSLMTHALQN